MDRDTFRTVLNAGLFVCPVPGKHAKRGHPNRGGHEVIDLAGRRLGAGPTPAAAIDAAYDRISSGKIAI